MVVQKDERDIVSNGVTQSTSQFYRCQQIYFTSGRVCKIFRKLLAKDQLSQIILETVFYRLDSVGIKESPSKNDDELVVHQFQSSLRRDKMGRYHVGWPWKDKAPKFENQFRRCKGRLRSLLRSYATLPNVSAKYDEIFREQLQKEIIELAPREFQSSIIQFLPHHAVIPP